MKHLRGLYEVHAASPGAEMGLSRERRKHIGLHNSGAHTFAVAEKLESEIDQVFFKVESVELRQGDALLRKVPQFLADSAADIEEVGTGAKLGQESRGIRNAGEPAIVATNLADACEMGNCPALFALRNG
ncbi:MAG: hypothetical protein Q9159_001597 [Coniocarpon cinnabarinum]